MATGGEFVVLGQELVEWGKGVWDKTRTSLELEVINQQDSQVELSDFVYYAAQGTCEGDVRGVLGPGKKHTFSIGAAANEIHTEGSLSYKIRPQTCQFRMSQELVLLFTWNIKLRQMPELWFRLGRNNTKIYWDEAALQGWHEENFGRHGSSLETSAVFCYRTLQDNRIAFTVRITLGSSRNNSMSIHITPGIAAGVELTRPQMIDPPK
jgi:hypothetical protein